jgi:hypothetical protein
MFLKNIEHSALGTLGPRHWIVIDYAHASVLNCVSGSTTLNNT